MSVVKMLSFNPDPLSVTLSAMGLLEVSPDLQQTLLQMSQVMHWLLVHASCTQPHIL